VWMSTFVVREWELIVGVARVICGRLGRRRGMPLHRAERDRILSACSVEMIGLRFLQVIGGEVKCCAKVPPLRGPTRSRTSAK
jgi:hypothetical protein